MSEAAELTQAGREAPSAQSERMSLDALQQRLDALSAQGLERFDPVRFRIMVAMIARAAQGNESVQQILVEKVGALLAVYQRDFTRAQQTAEARVKHLATCFPNHLAQAHRYFSDHNFKALRRLEKKLSQHKDSPLVALTREIAGRNGESGRPTEASADNPSFLDQLHQQEQAVLQNVLERADVGGVVQGGVFSPPRELKSVRRFRASILKHQAEKVVSEAISTGPENPGPLNAERLVIRTLTKMRGLSPEYTARLVNHLETLLWLEQAGKTVGNTRSKKDKG